MRRRIKVCCSQMRDQARTAIRLGADALGLVGKMPSGPGPVPDTTIAETAAACPPPVPTFLLTSSTAAQEVVDHVSRCCTRLRANTTSQACTVTRRHAGRR